MVSIVANCVVSLKRVVWWSEELCEKDIFYI